MCLRTAAGLILLAGMASAQTSSGSDAFYLAIRANDVSTLRTLVRDQGANARDAQGQTPLMQAAAFGTTEAVKLLLDAGADIQAVSNGGVTALHWAVTDVAKTRMLLDAGADVNAVSQLRRTPLIIAASARGTADVVRLLLARGARVNVADAVGVTPIVAAAVVNDSDVVNLLIANGADVNAAATTGQASTALMGASTNGNSALVRVLLDRKANVNAVSAEASGTVKNGLVQFGRITALHLAVLSGNPDVVRQLLAAGAAVDATDVRGMTPLMLAIATDRPEPRVVKLLVEAGADTSLRSKASETAVDWAGKFQHPAILRELRVSTRSRSAHASGHHSRQPPVSADAVAARAAAERSLPLLREASGRMLTHGGCVACHAQPLTGIAVNLARARGWTSGGAEAEVAQSSAQLAAASPGLLQFRDGGGLPDGLLYVAFLLTHDGKPFSRATDALVRYLAAKQRVDGSWEGVGGTRAPMQDGNFSRTALSIRALTAYATPALAAEYAERTRRGAAWLANQLPLSTEDRIMQLLGLHWAHAEATIRNTRTRELLSQQRVDGGWAQTRYLESDAYATGQVLYTLRELGMSASSPALQRGVAFLLRTQHEDGSWHVRNRAMKIQPYFEGGFPYEHDQWISHAGSAWAVMGIAATAIDAVPVRSVTRR